MASSNHHHPLPPPPREHPQQVDYLQQYERQQQQQQQQHQQQAQQHRPQQYQVPAQLHQSQASPLPPVSPPHHQPQVHYQQQQQQTQTLSRQRPAPVTSKSRAFSFHSEKSHKSSGSRVHETPAEKEAKRFRTKADPTFAMNEAEPAAVQASEISMLAPLRAIEHRDPFGNAIAEPDRSNPTRSRWERPLDTIRSFEAAIDGGSSRRSMVRSDTDWNRRSSYLGSKQIPMRRAQSVFSKQSPFSGNGPRFPQESYYGNRPASQLDSRASVRESLYDGASQYGVPGAAVGSGAGPSNRQRASRMQSEPHLNGSYLQRPEPNSLYPLQHRDRSYETVTSAAGSGISGDQGSYKTDPSSENSSIDRASPAKLPAAPPKPTNDYGIGFGQSPSFRPSAFSISTNANPSVIQKKPLASGAMPPPVPRKEMLQPSRPADPPKRKSWLTRRFSKAS